MKMTKEQFNHGVLCFIHEQVIPKVPGELSRGLVGGAAALCLPLMHEYGTILGISGPEGVDVEKLNVFFKGMFDAQPTIRVPGVGTFEREDAETLLTQYFKIAEGPRRPIGPGKEQTWTQSCETNQPTD